MAMVRADLRNSQCCANATNIVPLPPRFAIEPREAINELATRVYPLERAATQTDHGLNAINFIIQLCAATA